MEKWDIADKEKGSKLALRLNAQLPYDKDLFDLTKNWDHIHLCYQCDRKFGCNGTVCDDEVGKIIEIGWCAKCCESEYLMSEGGN